MARSPLWPAFNFLLYGLMQLPYGLLSDRMGRVRVLRVAHPAPARDGTPLGRVRHSSVRGEGCRDGRLLTYLAPALEAQGHGAAVAGLVAATYGVAVFGGMQVVKGVLRRLGISAATLIAIGGTLLILAYLAAAIEQGILNILLASMLVAFGYCFMHSTLQTWATEVVPEARGTATSLFVTGVYTGAALGTAAVSGLAEATRYEALFALAAAATLPVLLVGALGRSRYEAARAATARAQVSGSSPRVG